MKDEPPIAASTPSTRRPPASASRMTATRWLIFSIILLAAAFVRLSRIGSYSLWMDEIWSIEMSMGSGSAHEHLPIGEIQTDQVDLIDLSRAAPWPSIWSHMAGYIHPPLYHVILRWWMQCMAAVDGVGAGPMETRWLSVIFSLAALVAFFDLCRLLQGTHQALLAMAVMSLAIAQLDFAQQVRNYAMLSFCLLGAGNALARIEILGSKWTRLAALAFGLAAAALTHYFSLGALIALGIYAVIRLRGASRRNALIVFGVSALLVLGLWGPFIFSQLRVLPAPSPDFVIDPKPGHFPRVMSLLFRLPAQFLLGEDQINHLTKVEVWIPGLLTIAMLVRALCCRKLLFWAVWTIGCLGVILLMDLTRATLLVAFIRYASPAAPGIYALLASFDWPKKSALRGLLAYGLIAWLACACIQRISTGVKPRQDWRQMAEVIRKFVPADGLLVFYSPDVWNTPGTGYMGVRYYTEHFHHPWLLLNQPADSQLRKQLASYGEVWLIGPRSKQDGPFLLPGWAEAGTQPEEGVVISKMIHAD